MNHVPRFASTLLLVLRWAPLTAALAAAPGFAQYKVVGPDGKTTYTDRAPGPADGKVSSVGARGGAAAVDAALPLELRQAAGRYPVTLYINSGTCDPCESARQLLRQRGIPYSEKQIVTAEDSDAFEKLSGGRDVPTLTIGGQTLRGLSSEVWSNYLDAAGYPRESRLPKTYQYAAATPITERAPVRVPAPIAPIPREPAPAAPPGPTPTIRF